MTVSRRLLPIALVILVIVTVVVFIQNRDKINTQEIMDEVKHEDAETEVPKTQTTMNSKTIETGFYEFPESNEDPYYHAKLGEKFEHPNFPGWEIYFIEVISDNRCPINADCFAAGSARVKLHLIEKGTKTAFANEIELEVGDHVRNPDVTGQLTEDAFRYTLIQRKGVNAREINWRLALVDLVPYPTANDSPKSEDYIALFKLDILKR